jgi:uncharacterized membrane protein required for colicin V production
MKSLKQHPVAYGILVAFFGTLIGWVFSIFIADWMYKDVTEEVLKARPNDPLDSFHVLRLFMSIALGVCSMLCSFLLGWIVYLKGQE